MSLKKYIFITPIIFLLVIAYYLFNQQYINHLIYKSDWRAHVGFSSDSSMKESYSLLHYLVFFTSNLFYRFFNFLRFFDFVNVIMNIYILLSILFSYLILHKYFKQQFTTKYISSVVSISLLLVSMIVIDFEYNARIYLGNGSPNPWHNPTYLFLRPFALLLLFYVLEKYVLFSSKVTPFENISFALIGALTMWAKPSFLMSFWPVISLFVSYKVITRKIHYYYLLNLFLLIIPSIIVLYLINLKVFENAESSNKVAISYLEVWSYYSNNIFLSILLLILFPIYVLIISIKKDFNNQDLVIWANFILSLLYFMFLSETGDRKYDGNFSWTYLFASFLLFIFSIQKLFLHKSNKLKFNFGVFLFLIHLISGIYYFVKILNGGSYA